MNEKASGSPLVGRTEFATTQWSLVLAAGQQREDARASEALEKLCRTYWYPLYAYIRRRGYSPNDAEDLTQEFFARLLARDYLSRADPHAGKFRSFLLAGINYMLCDERDRARRLKRGGEQKVISFDEQSAETRYRLEPADKLTPEHVYERSWIVTLLERAAGRLREEYAAANKAGLYDQLMEFRLDAQGQRGYSEVAVRLGLSESAVKSAILRLRRRHHQLVREEIAETVADPSEVDGEIRYLLRMLE
jgi:RNA polymerase sigma factor (sigma-70 family)